MDEEKTLDLETVAENAAQADEQGSAEGKAEAKGRYVHRLAKPITLGEMQVTELVFDWEALTGADHHIACKRAMAQGWTVVIREFTPPYLTGMAERACTLRNEKGQRVLRYADLERLPMRDLTAIQDEARSFLRQSEPSPMTDDGSEDNA